MSGEQESDNVVQENEDTRDDKAVDNALSDALAALSLTTELDSALISHLNLLDDYMFHMECLFQYFRMVSLPSLFTFSHSGFLRSGNRKARSTCTRRSQNRRNEL